MRVSMACLVSLVSLVALCCSVRADPVVPEPIQSQQHSSSVVLEVLGVALGVVGHPLLPQKSQFPEAFATITAAGSSSKDEPPAPVRPGLQSDADEEPDGAGTGN